MEIILFNLVLAILLFFVVNWIGLHAVDFGYTTTTLFEDVSESVAMNFAVRVLAPSVFIVAVSAGLVASGAAWLREGIYQTVIFYFAIRMAAIFIVGRQELVSWYRFVVYATAGVGFALLAYNYLIKPNRSLLPDLNTAGNELWLAILAFLFAIGNKVEFGSELSARRRNGFIRRRYERARRRWGPEIEAEAADPLLRLLIYAVIIYEDYSRPPVIRAVERWLPQKRGGRTTGIMQVASDRPLSDDESVALGIERLVTAWGNAANQASGSKYEVVWTVLAEYNKDESYIERTLEVMEILAIRIDEEYRPAFEAMSESPRPVPTGEQAIIPAEVAADITVWMERYPGPKPSRSEAIRWLIKKGLEAE
jgi:hypothetical protein